MQEVIRMRIQEIRRVTSPHQITLNKVVKQVEYFIQKYWQNSLLTVNQCERLENKKENIQDRGNSFQGKKFKEKGGAFKREPSYKSQRRVEYQDQGHQNREWEYHNKYIPKEEAELQLVQPKQQKQTQEKQQLKTNPPQVRNVNQHRKKIQILRGFDRKLRGF